MKREYIAPKARKIDFIYNEQVAAQSVPSYNKGYYTIYEDFTKCCLYSLACTENFTTGFTCDKDIEGITPFTLR